MLCLIGALLTAMICGTILWGVSVVKKVDEQILHATNERVLVRDLSLATLEMRRNAREFVARHDLQDDARVKESHLKAVQTVQSLLNDPEMVSVRGDLERVQSGLQSYRALYEKLSWAISALWLAEDGGRWRGLQLAQTEVVRAVTGVGSAKLSNGTLQLLLVQQSYVISNSSGKIAELEAAANDLLADLEKENIPAPKKSYTAATIRAYVAAFRVLVDANQVVLSTANDLRQTYNNFAPSFTAVDTFIKKRNEEMAVAEDQMQQTVVHIALGVTAVLVVVALVLAVLVARSVVVPLHGVTEALGRLYRGEKEVEIPFQECRDEAGQMARAVGTLYLAVQEMERQRWVKATVAEISAHIQAAEDMRSLAQTVVSRLVPALGGGVGGFYLYDGGEQALNLFASYGYRVRKNLSNTFRLGDGLVGQCALEKQPIILQNVPEGYMSVTSGLGEGTPAVVVVRPILSKSEVMGVLEVASLRRYASQELELLEAMMPVIAMAMEILTRTIRAEELLQESRRQAELIDQQTRDLWSVAFDEASSAPV